ncbi:MAG: hypothetical protein HY892_13655, partial [Deltaproteobacteria bacterium]|nr:hypothetical protein [Deltaproteobacteria bacterium]
MKVKKMTCGWLAVGLIFVSGLENSGLGAEGQDRVVPPGKKNDRPLPVPE